MSLSVWHTGLSGVGRFRAAHAFLLVAAIGLAACGGGGGSDASAGGQPSSGGAANTGTGDLRVKVIDPFGRTVAGAYVAWLGSTTSQSQQSGADGVAQFDNIPAGLARVCASAMSGHTCGSPEYVTIEKDRLLDLTRQLEPYSDPVAAVLSTKVDPDGISVDGRSLDITLRILVSGAQPGGSWFESRASPYWGVHVLACTARTGEELAQLGPRCIEGVDGVDRSYALGGVTEVGWVRGIDLPRPPSAVGMLIDQSEAGLSPDWTPNEPRLFAARILADRLLPDTGLVLAGFASDEASGSSSGLPQRPVTFFPVEAPGLTTSRSEAFATLDDLSGMVGGGAPLYEAIAAGVDFMAERTSPDLRRVLVVLADGSDSTCGTPAQCAQRRKALVGHARASGVELVLVGSRDEESCLHADWSYCLEIHAREALRLLAEDGGMPLVVANTNSLHSPVLLVQQLLSGWATIQDVRLRLTSDSAGAFAPGAVVKGEFSGVNPSMCPFDCWTVVLPFNVEVPR